MCGIIGMLNRDPSAIGELITGLKQLEYRGYDSWGYAFVDGFQKIQSEKKIGRISSPSLQGNTAVAIGHTRWATHGGVTDANAHPHLDCAGRFAIVHNGILENYLELKEQLLSRRHVFQSQTDSEVVAHLLEEADGSLYEKARKVALQLKGSFALVILDRSSPQELAAIKNESPLVIGFSEDQIIFASDPLAFFDKKDIQMYLLEEGDVVSAKLPPGGSPQFSFFNYLKGHELSKEAANLDLVHGWSEKDVGIGSFSHYMLKEIFEQPKTLLRGIQPEAATLFAKELKGRKVVAVACGTARHAGIIGKHILQRVAHFPLDIMMAHEFSYFIEDMDPNAILLAISQSGETADVMECVRKAKARGIQVYSIVNVPSSSLARASERVFYINCGPEIAVASTKAFTSQILAFYLIAYAMAGRLDEAEKLLKGIASGMEENLKYFDSKAQEIANTLRSSPHVYMLGRGVNFPIALEGALKLKEISYLHAEGMPAGELKHGTLALIDKGTPVLLLAPSDYTYADSINNGLETKARGALLIGISDKPHPAFTLWVKLPSLENPLFYPFFETLVLQLIAYHTAVLLGRDVDRPRNLAKSVTVK